MTNPDAEQTGTSAQMLEPCPFCGGEATFNGMPNGLVGQIHCTSEECFGPRTTALTKQDSIVQWNTRDAVPYLVKVLEAAKDYIEPDTNMPRADRVLALIDAALSKVKP